MAKNRRAVQQHKFKLLQTLFGVLKDPNINLRLKKIYKDKNKVYKSIFKAKKA